MNTICSLRAGGCGYSTTLRKEKKKIKKVFLRTQILVALQVQYHVGIIKIFLRYRDFMTLYIWS